MARQARIDARGVLQHIIIRGIERKAIFRDGRGPGGARRTAVAKALPLTSPALSNLSYNVNMSVADVPHLSFILSLGEWSEGEGEGPSDNQATFCKRVQKP
jgi:hypothetical protein